jgi:hypothetical protein
MPFMVALLAQPQDIEGLVVIAMMPLNFGSSILECS